ncbi:MAG: isoprenyl transferase [Clostridia bacterium]|nr:isoprenyl transferase [Clostridia bacterium]
MLFKKENNAPRNVPGHIAIIMDGNGRWAKNKGMPRSFGHTAGAKKFKEIARYCNKIGVKYLTVYAFSTENWKRPKEEIDGIMNLLRDYLLDTANFKGENVRLRFIGDRESLPQDIRLLMENGERESEGATGMTAILALNYGGRDEITKAVRSIVANGVEAEKIDEALISSYLYTADIPDPDLIIRPSGEYRLSNFLTWQSAYSEFYFDNVLWPDFSIKDLEKAIDEYNRRNRRFGGV